jgi:hypothetical protein
MLSKVLYLPFFATGDHYLIGLSQAFRNKVANSGPLEADSDRGPTGGSPGGFRPHRIHGTVDEPLVGLDAWSAISGSDLSIGT